MCDGCEQYELNDALSRANKRGDDLWQRLLDTETRAEKAEAEAAMLLDNNKLAQNYGERIDSLERRLGGAEERAEQLQERAEKAEARAEKAEAELDHLLEWGPEMRRVAVRGLIQERDTAEKRAKKAEGLAKKYVEAFADEFVTLLEKWDLETSPDLRKSLRQWRAGETRPVEDVEAEVRRAEKAEARYTCTCNRSYRDRDGDVWTGNDRDGWKCVAIDEYVCGSRSLDELREVWGPLTEVTE
jgi:chromosome segregation ATPase